MGLFCGELKYQGNAKAEGDLGVTFHAFRYRAFANVCLVYRAPIMKVIRRFNLLHFTLKQLTPRYTHATSSITPTTALQAQAL